MYCVSLWGSDNKHESIHTKNSIDSDNVGEECSTEEGEYDNGHEEDSGSMFDGSSRASEPMDRPTSDGQECDSESNADQKNVQCLKATTSVNESNGECEKNPADNVIRNSCRQHDDAYGANQQ
jgi:hypothetical protein